MPESQIKNWVDLLEPAAIDQAINSLGPVNFLNNATNPYIVIGKIVHLKEIDFYNAATAETKIDRVLSFLPGSRKRPKRR